VKGRDQWGRTAKENLHVLESSGTGALYIQGTGRKGREKVLGNFGRYLVNCKYAVDNGVKMGSGGSKKGWCYWYGDKWQNFKGGENTR